MDALATAPQKPALMHNSWTPEQDQNTCFNHPHKQPQQQRTCLCSMAGGAHLGFLPSSGRPPKRPTSGPAWPPVSPSKAATCRCLETNYQLDLYLFLAQASYQKLLPAGAARPTCSLPKSPLKNCYLPVLGNQATARPTCSTQMHSCQAGSDRLTSLINS